MIKFRMYIDMDEEEKYLNKMAKKGYILRKCSYSGYYIFQKGSSQDLNYKIDYRVFKSKTDFEQYKTLFDDAGWIHVFGTQYSGGQYFLPKSDNLSSTEIFSDSESKAARYKRFFSQYLLIFIIYIPLVVAMLNRFDFDFRNMGYWTPGLWERTGFSFWFGFLFETPFVVLRLLPLALFFLFGYWAQKAYSLYKRGLKAAKGI